MQSLCSLLLCIVIICLFSISPTRNSGHKAKDLDYPVTMSLTPKTEHKLDKYLSDESMSEGMSREGLTFMIMSNW